MHLKRLELYGYKSFAARTMLEFGEGITAIVGPNGSGKSNVADAIRWVLGEQSYHALRAKTTDDMIFAGSRARPRLGMAEVLLTFDNSQGWLPLDYAEVTVGRRAYRSGENEYLLNGNRVRYRDILDLLGSAGLVRSTYLVIGQGLVDQALSLRPEARRALFEDAAGLAPHLRKRAEALSRIEETERNLERVNDILNELQPRAVTLRRQAERAEEYLLLAQDLKELQRIWYGYHWQRRQRQLVHAEDQVRAQSALVETQRAFYHRLQRQQEEWAAQEVARRQALERLAEEQRTLQEQTTRVRREQAVMTERQRLYQQQLAGLEEEIRSLRSRQGILQDEIARATQELVEQEALCTANDKALQEARAALDEQDAARRAQEQEAADLEAHLNQLVAALAADQGRLEQLRERRARLVAAGEETQRALRQAEERLWAGQEEGTHLAERAQALAQGVVEAQEQIKALEEETAHLRAQVNAAEEAVRKAHTERERIMARQEMLGRLRQELTGFPPGVREVLSAQEKLGGLVGTVVNLMQVPRELEEAIEAALGPRLHHIVTERWEDAEAAIAHLKRTRAGWATFLPLDTVRPRPALTLRPEPGIVGVASSLVHFEARLRPVFELLLGRIIIVADLATARRLLSRHTGATLLVTLEGETVQPSGALSGGSRKQVGNLLAQEREWRELPPRLAAAEQAWAEAQQHHTAQQQALASSLKKVEEARRNLAQLQAQAEAAQSAARNHAQEMRALERERAWRATRAEEAARELADLEQREQKLQAQIQATQAEQMHTLERLNALRAQLAASSDGELRHQVAALETRAAVAQRTVQSQRALLASHRQNAQQLQQQVQNKIAQQAQLQATLAQLAQEMETQQRALAEMAQQEASLTERAAPLRQELVELQRQQREGEQERTQSLERLNEAELEHSRLVLERDRLKEEQSSLAREIEAELGPIDLPSELSHQLRLELGDDIVELPTVDALPQGLGDEIRQLKMRLRRLGAINPDAPKEYEQLLERQTFLQTQAADLRGCIASLHEVIQELDALIEQDFVRTVKTVDDAFARYFRLLFNGGTAHLVLTDPQNPSATGVDIVAHPPGKKAQNLALLSGGERALTAVALLFALLQANPVPFCFLDEVDAALDEANVGRFRDLLCEHAKTTQFIVITHNRHTIEAASTLYGISMGEQGVSQCISLQLGNGNQVAKLVEETQK